MQRPDARLRLVLLAVFALSGFSGLAYESVWSHYLKLMLGHAAYAQSLVLVVYMGGMSLGAWLASGSARWRDPLRAYALIEAAIGLSALVFHPLFVATDAWLHGAVLPALGGGASAELARWSVGAALMLPQAVLLGMTFPLMSAAVLRLDPPRAGDAVASLYFTNCIGAALGVLVAAFLLVPAVGLPGTLLTAGLVNVVVACVAWLAGADARRAPLATFAPRTVEESAAVTAPRWLLLAAAATGLASFIYEIAWIRMLSLVLGSSMQAFELMLAAFLIGLALGGLWIRRRADLGDPLTRAARVQLLMGGLAVLTLPVHAASFGWMADWMASTARTDAGWTLHLIGSHGIALAVMLPATVMAGMTLPLFTAALMRGGAGEAGVGRVYAANTLGCIAGALVAVHVLLPVAGFHGAIAIGAGLDVAIGIALLVLAARAAPSARPARAGVALAAACVALVVGVGVFQRADPLVLASGVFRHGVPRQAAGTEILSQRDGKTATVTVLREPNGAIGILTNGKSDASWNPDPRNPGSDSATMVLLGALPLALRPDARRVANIGIGSGITTHALLAAPWLERVDTIEIEPEMVAGARRFGAASARAFDDPRSAIHIDDAKAWFAGRPGRYDIIVSEPSNPWVSGVASLFTREFYARVKTHLADDGLLVQWLQLYSTDPRLVASVLRALDAELPHWTVYATDDLNLLIVASRVPLGEPDAKVIATPALAALLRPIGVESVDDLKVRLLGREAQLAPLARTLGAPVNSDYFPLLSVEAPRLQFLRRDAGEFVALRDPALPVIGWLTGSRPAPDWRPAPPRYLRAGVDAWRADALATALAARRVPTPTEVEDIRLRWAAAIALDACNGAAGQSEIDGAIDEIARAVNGALAPERLAPLWDGLVPERCRARWPAESRDAYALARAVGAWDLEAAQSLAERLMVEHRRITPRLAITALAARIVRGDRAADAWAAYGALAAERAGWPMELRMLGALALGQGQRTVN